MNIVISTAVSDNKKTTKGFKIVELQTLQELLHTMNREAVASGLFSNSHRNAKYLRNMGNVYFIDIDTPPSADEKPYYQIIEDKLRHLNISFVSVPSKSADQYPYKRHIAVILDNFMSTGTKDYKRIAEHILKTIGIELSRIDQSVAFNPVAFLAPASINKNFSNYDEVSTLHDGKPLALPKHLQASTKEVTADTHHVKSNQLIKFADGSMVTVYEAKKIIAQDNSKPCYCPNHNDTKPSATFYHNSNGKAHIFCGVCGNIKIDTNFIPTEPTISHDEYNYSIVLENVPSDKIWVLNAKLGRYSYKTEKSFMWCYEVSRIEDIRKLLLAKVWLVQNGFKVSSIPAPKNHPHLLNTTRLQELIKNVTLPTPYIHNSAQLGESYFRYKQVAKYIFEHYLFVEATIYATYQNIIVPHRLFSKTCNLGLAYFEYVLQVQEKEKGLKSSDKTYPMRLQGKYKKDVEQKRVTNMNKAKKTKMTVRQKQIVKLMKADTYLTSNGKHKIVAMAKKLDISRDTLYRDMKVIRAKDESNK